MGKKLTKTSSASRVVYHVTPTRNRSIILREGLKICAKKRYQQSCDAVYVFAGLKIAIYYAEGEARDFEENFDIWKIKAGGKTIKADPMMQGYNGSLMVIDDIEPERMSLLKIISRRTTEQAHWKAELDADDEILPRWAEEIIKASKKACKK